MAKQRIVGGSHRVNASETTDRPVRELDNDRRETKQNNIQVDDEVKEIANEMRLELGRAGGTGDEPRLGLEAGLGEAYTDILNIISEMDR